MKFQIKVNSIFDTKNLLIELDDYSKVSSLIKKLYYEVKEACMIKYPSDNTSPKLAYLYMNSASNEKIVLTSSENYIQYFADKYNINEFNIVCHEYIGNPQKIVISFEREQLTMGDDVNLISKKEILPEYKMEK